METRQKFILALLIVFMFMLGVLMGLWASKNTFEHCNEDLKYCVGEYREHCLRGLEGINFSEYDILYPLK